VLLRSCSLTHAELIQWCLKLGTFLRFYIFSKSKNVTFYVCLSRWTRFLEHCLYIHCFGQMQCRRWWIWNYQLGRLNSCYTAWQCKHYKRFINKLVEGQSPTLADWKTNFRLIIYTAFHKKGTSYSWWYLCQILTDSQNVLTNLQYVVTLPYEILMSENKRLTINYKVQ